MKLADKISFVSALFFSVLVGVLGYIVFTFLSIELELFKKLSYPTYPIFIFFIYGPFIYTSIASIFFAKKLTLKQTFFLSILAQIIIFILYVLLGPDGVFTDPATCGYYNEATRQWVDTITLKCIAEELYYVFRVFAYFDGVLVFYLPSIVFIMTPVVFKYFSNSQKKVSANNI